MNKNEIIASLARKRVIEEIIDNILTGQKKPLNLDDLAQDLYLDLARKPEHKIKMMYENDEIKYFITKMVKLQLNSGNSPYHMKYRRYNQNRTDISEIKEEE